MLWNYLSIPKLQRCNHWSFEATDPWLAPLYGWWNASSWFQLMICRLFVAKPSPKPMLIHYELGHKKKNQWNSYQHTTFFIYEKGFEQTVDRMVATLSRPQPYKCLWEYTTRFPPGLCFRCTPCLWVIGDGKTVHMRGHMMPHMM